MSVETLSVKDICAIMRECRKSGISEFKHNGLELRFGNEVPQEPLPPKTPEQIQLARELEAAALAENEYQVKVEKLELLKIQDPEEYEALIARGELGYAGEGPTGTELS